MPQERGKRGNNLLRDDLASRPQITDLRYPSLKGHNRLNHPDKIISFVQKIPFLFKKSTFDSENGNAESTRACITSTRTNAVKRVR